MPGFVDLILAGAMGGVGWAVTDAAIDWWRNRPPRGQDCPDCGELAYDLDYHRLWCKNRQQGVV